MGHVVALQRQPSETGSERLDAIGRYYDGLLKDYERFWGLKRHRRLHYGYFDDQHRSQDAALENLDRILTEAVAIKRGERVIDAGCGVGGSSIFMAKELGAVVTAVNISDGQLSYARAAAQQEGVADRITLHKADMTKTGLPDHSFDVFYAVDSIGHVDSLDSVFGEAYRLLRPGGRLVYTEFVRSPSFTQEDWARNARIDRGMGGVAPCRTREDLCGSLTKARFSAIEHRDISGNVRPSMRKARRMSMLGVPYTWLLTRLGLRDQLHCDAAVAVFELASMAVEGKFSYLFGTARKPATSTDLSRPSGPSA
jgi:tocopherol O-methyltransferase